MNDVTPSAAALRPNKGSAWGYRCYRLIGRKQGWKATAVLKHLAHGIPRAFFWTKAEDRDGLCNYIDMVTSGRAAAALLYEHEGLAVDIEHDPEELTGTIKIGIKVFLDLMAHRGDFEIPLREKIQFTTDGEKLVPAHFIAALAEYADNPEWFGDPADWRWATPEDLDRISGGNPLNLHTGMYRGKENFMDSPAVIEQAQIAAGIEPAPPETAPAEIEISRQPYHRHFELLTQVRPHGQQPYFVRRLALYDGRLLWAASAYNLLGPWRVYERDTALLLAHGLQP